MTTNSSNVLKIIGARENNLKNISLDIPLKQLVVVTGLSGSGKSSLAFDTIYAEGQRRYLETLSSYARPFVGKLERADVDLIDGLSPVISIEQKTISKNPRSTVGTITEIYDFLRLLYARVSVAYSYVSGKQMSQNTVDQIAKLIVENYEGKLVYVLSSMVKARKGHYKELFEKIRRKGFLKVRVDGKIVNLAPGLKLSRYQTHNIETVVDQIKVDSKNLKRLVSSIENSLKLGKGNIMVTEIENEKNLSHYSQHLMCEDSGISYLEPEPNSFSFNSPYGACPSCKGLGVVPKMNLSKVIPEKNASVKNGGIQLLAEVKSTWVWKQVETVLKNHGLSLNTKAGDLTKETLDELLYGSEGSLSLDYEDVGVRTKVETRFAGILEIVRAGIAERSINKSYKWLEDFVHNVDCTDCEGTRLMQQARFFKIDGKNIAEVSAMDLGDFHKWVLGLNDKLDDTQSQIAEEILNEIEKRVAFLLNVGLHYLSISRGSKTLSGGEAQRIRLATQIGSQLTNILYILDEPSIGLHASDNAKLIASLLDLKKLSNSIIVVEHDKEIMLKSDYIIDIGPKAGLHGGEVVASGKPNEIMESDTVTGNYLRGNIKIEIPDKRRAGNGQFIKLKGAAGHNLQSVDLKLPLGTLICITGVSGSGKSSLIHGTLYPLLTNAIYRSSRPVLDYKKIEGIENVDKVIEIDQSPIGRTPRSNPATYTGAFSEIRKLFSLLPEAKIRGFKPGRFSFNVKGGRCENCMGAGLKTIEMNFLPNVYVNCEVCNGKRYNRETLAVRYKGKSISDVLEMDIDEANTFFEHIRVLNKILQTLVDVGLGYVKLGQFSTTLSGGEAQRVKLASELFKRDTGQTLYLMDEPSTGLHFEDIQVLLNVIQRLVERGNTVVIIEHNMDFVKVSDHVIDLGPQGGRDGGEIVASGTPEQIVKNKLSLTGKYLKEELV